MDQSASSPFPESAETWRSRYFDLVEFVQSFSWFDEREEFYESLAANLGKMTGADNVNIRLLSYDQDAFVLYASHGDVEPSVNREYDILSASAGRMPDLIETGKPILFDFENPTNDDIDWKRGVEDGYACSATIALTGPRGIVGAVDFLFHKPRVWTDEDISWLTSLGEFVGAVIDNALLSDNMFSLRVANERRSLSNEIHDNMAQAVSVISLEADNALDSLAHHDDDMLERNLSLIKRASDEIELIVRSELLNLSNGFGTAEEASMESLDRMVEAFCGQWGIEYELVRDDRSRTAVIPKLVMIQLTRVVNEALVNVVRHAQASKVKVSYRVDDEGLSLSVEDDGCGFDPSDIPPAHLGLRIMRDRLGTIGGSMDVDSGAGRGTDISIEIPRLV